MVFGLCWSRDEGLVFLINLVCLGNHIDIDKGLDFFSTTLE